MTLARQLLIMIALATLSVLALNKYALGFEIEYPERYERPEKKPQVRSFVQRHKPSSPQVVTKTVTKTVYVDPPKPKPEPRCKPLMSALGDSAKSIEAAQLEAMKSLKAAIQFNHGNKFLSVEAMDDIEYQCAPSTVPFFGGRIENVVGKVLPVQSYVCKVSAAPCEASVTREYGGK